MSDTQTTPFRNFSRTLAAAVETLFPAEPSSSSNERFIVNPNAANTLWVHPMGGTPVANAAGSIPILPNGSLRLHNCDEVKVLGSIGDSVTAYLR